MYLNLLLRSLRGDNDSRRVKAFVKRMLQVLTLHQPPFACGLIYVIIQLQRVLPDLGMLLTEPEDLADESESGLLGGVSRRPSVSEPGRPEDATARVYDGRKRDPEHSNAHKSCLWEAVSLPAFSPSVLTASRCLPWSIITLR
jgi:ribosome biogenesis protein MAK21